MTPDDPIRQAADDYVTLLSASGSRWALHAMGDLSDEYEKKKLIASLAALGNPFDPDDVEREFGIERLNGRDAMIQLGRILIQSLAQDVSECLTAPQQATFETCHVRMIDIGETNALCAHTDITGSDLPGFVILVNQGLYFCLKLLITAQIYEDLQGDLAQYKRSGDDVFGAAVDLFLTEAPDKLNVGAVFTGDETVDGTIEAHVSLGSTLLMQFVILHELGHAHLGHGPILGLGRLHALAAAGKGDAVPPNRDHWEAEFEADAFAWECLARRAQDPLKNLANLYCIRLFFGFLEAIEHRLGTPISGAHPPPGDRRDAITRLFAPDGVSPDHQSVFDQQDAILARWSQAPAGTADHDDPGDAHD